MLLRIVFRLGIIAFLSGAIPNLVPFFDAFTCSEAVATVKKVGIQTSLLQISSANRPATEVDVYNAKVGIAFSYTQVKATYDGQSIGPDTKFPVLVRYDQAGKPTYVTAPFSKALMPVALCLALIGLVATAMGRRGYDQTAL
jgi:hypothetical protein